MEGIQEHHPYETEKKSGTRALETIDRMCAYMRRGERIRTVDEHPKFRKRGGNEILCREGAKGSCSEVEGTYLVCHGSLNPEVQYVYHWTTHVPYNTAYRRTRVFSVRRHREQGEDMGKRNLRWQLPPGRWAPRSYSCPSPCWLYRSVNGRED
jgi:hypothetical protein